MNDGFWKNWSYVRNGFACNLEFFANSFEHAEKTLRAAPSFMDIPCALDVAIVPANGGGYIATIYAPLWMVHHYGIKESE